MTQHKVIHKPKIYIALIICPLLKPSLDLCEMFLNIEQDFSTRDKYLLPLTLPYSTYATNLRIISHERQFVQFELFKSTILC